MRELQNEHCWNQKMYYDSTLMSWLHTGPVPQEEKSSLLAPPIPAKQEESECMSPSDLKALPTEMQLSKCNCIYLSCSILRFILHWKKWTKKGNINWFHTPDWTTAQRCLQQIRFSGMGKDWRNLKSSFPSTNGITTNMWWGLVDSLEKWKEVSQSIINGC